MTLERSFSIASLARYSCTKPNVVLPSTTASTITASGHSPAIAEIMAAKTRIRTSGLLNWFSSSLRAVVWLPAWIKFGP